MDTESRPNVGVPNTGQGTLIVHVTTARGSIPLEGALVHVRNGYPEGASTKGDVLTTRTTNRDGNTPRISLSAPPRQNTLTPNAGNTYTPYNIDVYLEGYFTQNYLRVPIFDGITAIQPVDMIPLPENGRTDSRTPDSERFLDSTGPDL